MEQSSGYIGFEQALDLVRANAGLMPEEELAIGSCTGYVSARRVRARVDSPPGDSSLKDGFAVRSLDLMTAGVESPVVLRLVGSAFAGVQFRGSVLPGETVRVCSGALIPAGADAVVPNESCNAASDAVIFTAAVDRGQDVCPRGDDVMAGMTVAGKGQLLLPGRLALVAMAGIDRLTVYRKPRFAIVSIGDELMAPGDDPQEGHIYASNVINMGAWLSFLRIPFVTATVGDDAESIERELLRLSPEADAIVTSGGVMHSERDLIVGALDRLGWRMVFRHVRMGPGKATSFGQWRNKPVFCLSGGPSSNGVAFLQFVLLGALRMMGLTGGLPLTVSGRLTRDVKGRDRDWTEFKEARLARDSRGQFAVTPASGASRSRAMADADCLLCKPEGVVSLDRGEMVTVQLMLPALPADLGRTPALRRGERRAVHKPSRR